jgi:hypothetical protein
VVTCGKPEETLTKEFTPDWLQPLFGVSKIGGTVIHARDSVDASDHIDVMRSDDAACYVRVHNVILTNGRCAENSG